MKQPDFINKINNNIKSNIKTNKSCNKITGNKGESIASDFLKNLGYKIIIRNYQRRIGEIDIIAFKNNVIHFMEVKSVTRETAIDSTSKNYDYLPEEQVNFEKMLHMKRTIELFLFENNIMDFNIQINVITVIFYKSDEAPRINFIENVCC